MGLHLLRRTSKDHRGQGLKGQDLQGDEAGRQVEVYNITKPICIPEIAPLPWNTEPTVQSAQQAIDEYFIHLDADFEDSCLTTPLLGVIVEAELNSTLPEDN